ncbi:alpha-ketoglutarate-dependent dioxygenase AlkB [Lysobacter sp. BMK333-48F3]|uniref:alpha-ketoglutarate-dependent dioxygenase AlkB family protein n=1 Tax=Lysobacter sp. BMK333-48F3 TaxID=2867962 RepID=UPI001C8BF438|nr:alpha-ketoglutarate-dependent dioxygenase AlkB [Lysobacter sp. BMK333-48F3]MBX9403172.1 alpha-ketoglutarate-dependent dioxygenase AlkB [Lysobacter sp. BMK333-48F3]
MHQASLFAPTPQQFIADAEGGVRYLPGVFGADEAAQLFDSLLAQADWNAQTRMMYERLVDVPRRIASYRLDRDRLPPLLAQTAQRVGERLETAFNSVGLNLYRDGADSVALHNDKLDELIAGQPIAVLSLGATRRMLLRAKRPPHRQWQVELEPGSLLVMSHASQRHYDHGIPKAPGVSEARISLAFRVRPG